MHQNIWCGGDSAPGGPSQTWCPNESSLNANRRVEPTGFCVTTAPFNRSMKHWQTGNNAGFACSNNPLDLGNNYCHPLSQTSRIQQATLCSTGMCVHNQRKLSYLDLTEAVSGDNNALSTDLRTTASYDTYSSMPTSDTVEELSLKCKKLDYLQRCLKRYEIERVEAGEAVRRIEDRLQELQERTSDLLAGYPNDLPSTDRRCVGELQTLVSTANRRRESHFRPNAKFNNMYVEAEELLYDTKSIGLPALYERLESQPKLINNGSTIQINPEATSVEGFKTEASSRFQQTPMTRKRLQQLQTHYSVLTEHLNRQRTRLASADATVADLVKTLFKFGIEDPSNQMPKQKDNAWTGKSMCSQPAAGPCTRTSITESKCQNTRLANVKHLPMPAWPDTANIRISHKQHDIDQGRHKFATICARSTCHLSALDSENTTSFGWEQPQIKLLSADQAFRRKFFSLTRPVTQTSTTRLATNEYIPLSDTCSYFAQLPTSVHSHSNDSRYFTSAFHSLPQKYRQNAAHLFDLTGPEIAPPLPPKPCISRISLTATNNEDPQCVEDEEVSKFMANPNVFDGENPEKEQVTESAIAFLDLVSVQRPPPPPYYVNLFDSEKRKKQSQLDVTLPSQQTDSPGTKQSSPPPRSTTPEVHRNSTSPQQLQTNRKITSTSRRYTRPSQVCQINLPEYLTATGHPLERLIRQPDQSRSGTPQMKSTSQTATCFNSLLTRWFRAGSHRMPKHRGRTRSLDENETKIQLPLSFDSLSSLQTDARVILTRVRCEGYLWMLRQPGPGRTHVTNTRPRPRPWQSLRDHYRGLTSDTSGQNSVPSVTQYSLEKRESQQWKQMWFVCDLAGRIFTSQQEPNRERHKDCIPLSSIQSIRINECSNLTDMCKSSQQHCVPEAESITTDALPNAMEINQSQQTEKDSLNPQECLTRSLTDHGQKDEEPQWTDSLFYVDSLTRTYTLRAANTELRALWVAVLEVGKNLGKSS